MYLSGGLHWVRRSLLATDSGGLGVESQFEQHRSREPSIEWKLGYSYVLIDVHFVESTKYVVCCSIALSDLHAICLLFGGTLLLTNSLFTSSSPNLMSGESGSVSAPIDRHKKQRDKIFHHSSHKDSELCFQGGSCTCHTNLPLQASELLTLVLNEEATSRRPRQGSHVNTGSPSIGL
jgi:hypothetical protein